MPAYQFAVVVDDAAMAISEVVRGADLLGSTAQQILIYRALGFDPPAFYHCPLVTDRDGRRLAKRAGAHSLRALRETGADPARICLGTPGTPVVGCHRDPVDTDDLFSPADPDTAAPPNPQAPLATRMRPRSLDEYVGQEHLLAPGKLLRRAIEADRLVLGDFPRPARHRQDEHRGGDRAGHPRALRAV